MNLVNKEVTVYSDPQRRHFEDVGKIQKVLKQLNEEEYVCDVIFDEGIFTKTIHVDDVFFEDRF